MNFVFDLILAVIMIAIIFSSYKKGFVASVLSLASVVISSVCAWIFHYPLAEYISTNFISSPIINGLNSKISSFSADGDLDKMLLEMPEGLKKFLSDVGADPETIREGFESAGISSGEYIQSIATDLGSSLSHAFSVGIALLAIYIVVYTVCIIASFAINSIFKLPILKQANKLLSLCFGIAGALLFAWLFSQCSVRLFDGLMVLDPVNFDPSVLKSSFLINFFYNINPYTIFSR